MPLKIKIKHDGEVEVPDSEERQSFLDHFKGSLPKESGEYEWQPVREVREGDNEHGSIYRVYDWVKKKLSKSG